MLQGDDRKAHRVALDHIEASLLNGKYKVGAKLPPERDLAKELGVSRGAVREAIRVLQAQGILESHPGPGRGTRIIAGHTAALGRLFRLHLALSSTSALDLTDTLRRILHRGTPVYGLYGADDGLYSAAQLDALRKLLGPDHMITLDSCSHNVFIDRRHAFIEALTRHCKTK